jgi:hypothetical protein
VKMGIEICIHDAALSRAAPEDANLLRSG